MTNFPSQFSFGASRATIFVTLLFLCGHVGATPTVSRSVESKPSKLTAQLDFSGSRGSDELDHYTIGSGLTVNYRTLPWHTAYLSTGFTQPTVKEVERPERYGASDSSIGYSIRRLFYFENGFEGDGDLSLTFPTSTISNRTSLITSVSPSFSIQFPLFSPYLIGRSRHGAGYSFYTYETSDAAGFRFNSPWWISNELGLSLRFDRTTTSVDYDFHHFKDFAGTTINVQSLRTSFNFAISKRVTASAYARWRDRTITNNALFDTDTRVVGMALKLFM